MMRTHLSPLSEAIERAKAGDPFARVTVVTPGNLVGLQLRRQLVDRTVAEGPGLLNVDFRALDQIAEDVGRPILSAAGKEPLGDLARLRALRQALAGTALERLADHGPSVEQIARQLDELSKIDLLEIEGTFFEVIQNLKLATKNHASARDLYEAALAAPLDAFDGFGSFVALHAKPDEPGYASRLRQKLEEAGRLSSVALESCHPTSECWILPDAEEECRSAAAYLAGCAEAGIPLHQMAALFPTRTIYGSLVSETLDAAGIRNNKRSARRIGESEAGRFLSGLLASHLRGFQRGETMDWLSSSAFSHAGKLVQIHKWDRLTKQARVTKGLEEWRTRLEHFGESARDRAASEIDDRVRERALKQTERCEEMASFLEDLQTQIQKLEGASTWEAYRRWTRNVLEKWLPSRTRKETAYELLMNEIEGLDSLEEFCPAPTLADYRAAVEFIMERTLGAREPFGQGVFVGTIKEAFGLRFEVILVLGMTETNLPQCWDSGLLDPQQQRKAGLPDLEAKTKIERAYFDAVQTATKQIVYSYPRADLRAMRETMPSLWFLEEVGLLAEDDHPALRAPLQGRGKIASFGQPPREGGDHPALQAPLQRRGIPVYFDELETLTLPRLKKCPSFAAALKARGPATSQEFNLLSLFANRETGLPPEEHSRWSTGVEAQHARRDKEITVWDGGARLKEQPRYSASALEKFGKCPFQFFLASILRLKVEDEVSDIWNVDAREKGTAIHDALRRFYEEQLGRPGTSAWAEEDHQRLQSLLDQALDSLVARAFVRDSPAWRFARHKLKGRMREYLDRDSKWRVQTGEPLRLEFAFGKDEPLPVEIGGVPIPLKGFIDRLDFNRDTCEVTVIDYKSGSGSGYKKHDPRNPLQSGRLYQLPIYGEAVRALANELSIPADAKLFARYVFLEPKDSKEDIQLDLQAVQEIFHHNVATLDALSKEGLFPANPGGHRMDTFNNCIYCEFNRLCPSKREEIWQRKKGDPRLRAYIQMIENDTEEQDGESA